MLKLHPVWDSVHFLLAVDEVIDASAFSPALYFLHAVLLLTMIIMN